MGFLQKKYFTLLGLLLVACGPQGLITVNVDAVAAGRPYYTEIREQAVYLVKLEDNSLIALKADDPGNQACPVRWDQQNGFFQATCSGSRFDLQGQYLMGPAPRDLDQFSVKLQDQQAIINPGAVIAGKPRP